jgi:cholesterol transport system auxiliary component
MMKIPGIFKLCLMLSLSLLIQSCTTPTSTQHISYDFGTLPKSAEKTPLTLSVSVAEVNAPSTLDSNAMLYRLRYDNEQQLHPYAQHRWSMPPAQLLTQRLKEQIAASGGTVVSVTDGVSDLPMLRIDLDEFSQIFTTPKQSHAQITMRASLMKRNKLIAQRYFTFEQEAQSADASAGANAMKIAADTAIAGVILWLQGLPPN